MAAVDSAQAEFRAQWNGMRRPPFAAAFAGDAEDVRALDYLHYEGFADPSGGLEAASLVWGDVLRRAAGMEWMLGWRDDLLLASVERDVVIWPFAKVFEVRGRSVPQYGKYQWAMEQAVVDLVSGLVAPEVKHRLFRTIPRTEGGFVRAVLDDGWIASELRDWKRAE